MKLFSSADASRIALGAAMLSLCSWIAVPAAVPFTFQNFAIVLLGAVLGGKRVTAAIGVYILCGIVGMPIFAGFRGGVGAVLSATGGYILGFLPLGGIVGYICRRYGRGFWAVSISGALGMAACYIVGTVWYSLFFADGRSVGAVLSVCVLPFVIPDFIKILMAAVCVKRFKNI